MITAQLSRDTEIFIKTLILAAVSDCRMVHIIWSKPYGDLMKNLLWPTNLTADKSILAGHDRIFRIAKTSLTQTCNISNYIYLVNMTIKKISDGQSKSWIWKNDIERKQYNGLQFQIRSRTCRNGSRVCLQRSWIPNVHVRGSLY